MTVDFIDIAPALVAFRRDIHAHPELGFQEQRTAARIADFLGQLGMEVHTGVGRTGVVGVLKVGTSNRSVGLRADMDALPIKEMTGLDYSSRTENVFHGCGHDGHVAMLLGAAKVLSSHRNFDGTVNFIFQPAEEGLGGAKVMIEDGLFERFPCDRVFALHNWPALPAGVAATRRGAIMAAADKFEIVIEGKGGHAALPSTASDVIGAAAQLILQLKTLVTNSTPPGAMAVLSVTRIAAGHTHNVLPASATIGGTVRTFDTFVQDRIEAGLRSAAEGVAIMTGTRATTTYDRYYPATINDSDVAEEVMAALEGVCETQLAETPALTSEDFSYMLRACRGAYIWLGQGPVSGEGGIPLHNPGYDFNDNILETGVAVNIALAHYTLSPKSAV